MAVGLEEVEIEALLDRIDTLLQRKRRLDRGNNLAGYDRWSADTLELLLRLEAGRRVKEDRDDDG